MLTGFIPVVTVAVLNFFVKGDFSNIYLNACFLVWKITARVRMHVENITINETHYINKTVLLQIHIFDEFVTWLAATILVIVHEDCCVQKLLIFIGIETQTSLGINFRSLYLSQKIWDWEKFEKLIYGWMYWMLHRKKVNKDSQILFFTFYSYKIS